MSLQARIEEALKKRFPNHENGINLSEASRKLGISRPSLANWIEHGESAESMTLKKLKKLAANTNRRIEWFLQNDDMEINDKESFYLITERVDLDKKTRELANIINQLISENALTNDMANDMIGYLKLKTGKK